MRLALLGIGIGTDTSADCRKMSGVVPSTQLEQVSGGLTVNVSGVIPRMKSPAYGRHRDDR